MKTDLISDRAAELCSGIVGLAFGDVSGIAQSVAAMAGVALLGKRLQQGAAGVNCRSACIRAINSLTKHQAFSADALERASLVLAERPSVAVKHPADILGRVKETDPAKAIAAEVAKTLVGPDDPEVLRILSLVLEVGIQSCMDNDEFRAALTPELLMQNARDLGLLSETVQRMDRKLDELPAQLLALLEEKGIAGRDRGDLERLAAKFNMPTVDLTNAELVEALQLKAEDYGKLTRIVEALDDRMSEVAEMKYAADEAVRQLELSCALALLREVDRVETEITLSTRMIRVEVALLQGDVEEAKLLLGQARDMACSYSPYNFPEHTYNCARLLSDWAERNASVSACKAAAQFAAEVIEGTEPGVNDEVSDLRVSAASTLATVFSAWLNLAALKAEDTENACATLDYIQQVRVGDTTPGGEPWARLTFKESELISNMVEAGIFTNADEMLAACEHNFREVLRIGKDDDRNDMISAAAGRLVSVIRQRAVRADNEFLKVELLQEARELFDEYVSNPAYNKDWDDLTTELTGGGLEVQLALLTRGPMRDMALASTIDRHERLIQNATDQNQLTNVLYASMTVAQLAVLRAEEATAQLKARLMKIAMDKVEAAAAAIVDQASTRHLRIIEELRFRLESLQAA